MRRRSLSTLAIGLALGLIAAGCGQPDSHYLSRKSDGVFVKVPRSWTVYGEGESYEAAISSRGGLTQRELQRGPYWVRVLSAGSGLGANDVMQSVLDFPTGVVEVRPMFPDEAEVVSPLLFRRELLAGFGQYSTADFATLVQNRLVTVIDERQVEVHGYQGLEVFMSLQMPGASDETLGNFTGPNLYLMGKAYFNIDTRKLVMLRLFCLLSCSERDFSAMESVYNSVTLRTPS